MSEDDGAWLRLSCLTRNVLEFLAIDVAFARLTPARSHCSSSADTAASKSNPAGPGSTFTSATSLMPLNVEEEKGDAPVKATSQFADPGGRKWTGFESCGSDCDVARSTSQLTGSYRQLLTSAHGSGRLMEPPQELDSDGAPANVTVGSISPEGKDPKSAPSETELTAAVGVGIGGAISPTAAFTPEMDAPGATESKRMAS